MNESSRLVAAGLIFSISILSSVPAGARTTTIETIEDLESLDPYLYYPKSIEYKGGLRSWSAYSPVSLRQSSQNTFFAKGHASDLAMGMAVSLESQDEKSRLRDSFLDLGKPGFQLRLGDYTEVVPGFRAQMETRRGIRWSGWDDTASWSGQFSPASLNDVWSWQSVAPRSIVGIQTHLTGQEAHFGGSLERSVYEKSGGGSSLGSITAGISLAGAGALSVALALSQPDDQGNSNLARSGHLRWEGRGHWLGGRALVEKNENGFVSLGDPRLYQGRQFLEVQPRLFPDGKWQPYLGYSREDIERPATGQTSNQNRQTMGMQAMPSPRVQWDLNATREFREDSAWRQGFNLSTAMQGQGANRLYLSFSMERSLAPLSADEWNGLCQAGYGLTESWDLLWTSSPQLFQAEDGIGNHASWLNTLEMTFRSWDEVWGFRMMGGLQVQQSGGQQPVHDLSGLAGFNLVWEGWTLQPEARLSQYRVEEARFLNYGWNLRLSRDFSFGASPITAQVQGVVFEDSNRNRQLDADEAGVPGVEVLVDGQVQATTDEKGAFRFENLMPESHELALNWDSVPPQYQPEPLLTAPLDLRQERLVRVQIPLHSR